MTENTTPPDGGAGGGGGPDGQTGGDMVKRSELDKAASRRDSAIADKNAAIKAQADIQAEFDAYKASAKSEAEASHATMAKDLADANSKIRRRDFADAVLGDVPTNDQRTQADLMLTGLMAKNGIDPLSDNWEDAAKETADSLRSLAPHLFSSPSGAPAAQPTAAGGGVQGSPNPKDWSQYKTTAELPKELWGTVPKKEWERMKRGGDAPIPGFTR